MAAYSTRGLVCGMRTFSFSDRACLYQLEVTLQAKKGDESRNRIHETFSDKTGGEGVLLG